MRKAVQDLWAGRGAVAFALSPLALAYGLGWKVYAGMYALGVRRGYRSTLPSVCIGNLTAGGTGKTPTVAHVARVLATLGRKVVLSVSGYGAPVYSAPAVAPDGPLDPREWGDEAALLRWWLPDFPLVAGKRRAVSARLAERAFPGHVLLLDDGFQHLAFSPCVSVVLDPDRPNRFCFPAGPFREPRTAGLARATAVIPGRFTVERSPRLTSPPDETPATATECDLLCAVGSPDGLVASVESMGVRVVGSRFLADHDPLDSKGLLDGLGLERPIVVTGKDWVKLKSRCDLGERRFLVADYDVAILPAEEFAVWIGERLSECLDAAGD